MKDEKSKKDVKLDEFYESKSFFTEIEIGAMVAITSATESGYSWMRRRSYKL